MGTEGRTFSPAVSLMSWFIAWVGASHAMRQTGAAATAIRMRIRSDRPGVSRRWGAAALGGHRPPEGSSQGAPDFGPAA